MAIDKPTSDTSRGIQHEPNMEYPQSVVIQLAWEIGEETHYRTIDISADRFFGHGQYGAPIDGSALIGMIENMRREGPVVLPKRKPNAKTKK